MGTSRACSCRIAHQSNARTQLYDMGLVFRPRSFFSARSLKKSGAAPGAAPDTLTTKLWDVAATPWEQGELCCTKVLLQWRGSTLCGSTVLAQNTV